MKVSLEILCLALLGILASGCKPTEAPGRFTVIAGYHRYQELQGDKPLSVPCVIKLDTVTGRSWVLTGGAIGRHEWTEIPHDPP